MIKENAYVKNLNLCGLSPQNIHGKHKPFIVELVYMALWNGVMWHRCTCNECVHSFLQQCGRMVMQTSPKTRKRAQLYKTCHAHLSGSRNNCRKARAKSIQTPVCNAMN